MTTKIRFFLSALGLALPIDQLTKLLIVDRFHYAERLVVIPEFFALTHVRNPGGAFSFFANGAELPRMAFFIGTTLIAMVLLVIFLRRLEPGARLSSLALGLILGGAIGNLIDRIAYGEVIDFLEFTLWGGYTWPTFNMADTWIVTGVLILMVEIFFEEDPESAAGDEGEPSKAVGRSAG